MIISQICSSGQQQLDRLFFALSKTEHSHARAKGKFISVILFWIGLLCICCIYGFKKRFFKSGRGKKVLWTTFIVFWTTCTVLWKTYNVSWTTCKELRKTYKVFWTTCVVLWTTYKVFWMIYIVLRMPYKVLWISWKRLWIDCTTLWIIFTSQWTTCTVHCKGCKPQCIGIQWHTGIFILPWAG